MSSTTQLSLYGGIGLPYGSFAGKSAAPATAIIDAALGDAVASFSVGVRVRAALDALTDDAIAAFVAEQSTAAAIAAIADDAVAAFEARAVVRAMLDAATDDAIAAFDAEVIGTRTAVIGALLGDAIASFTVSAPFEARGAVALLAAFRAAWGSTSPVAWPNRAADPSAWRDGWVSVRIEHQAGELMGFPAAPSRLYGRVVITCYCPEGAGVAPAYALADEALAFLEAHEGLPDGRRIRNPRLVEAGVSDGWYAIEVSGDFGYLLQ